MNNFYFKKFEELNKFISEHDNCRIISIKDMVESEPKNNSIYVAKYENIKSKTKVKAKTEVVYRDRDEEWITGPGA